MAQQSLSYSLDSIDVFFLEILLLISLDHDYYERRTRQDVNLKLDIDSATTAYQHTATSQYSTSKTIEMSRTVTTTQPTTTFEATATLRPTITSEATKTHQLTTAPQTASTYQSTAASAQTTTATDILPQTLLGKCLSILA